MRRLLLAGVVVWVAGCPQPLAKRCGQFQRDNANSANITMPLTPWSCP